MVASASGVKAKRKSIIRIKSTAEDSVEKAAVDYGNTAIDQKNLTNIWNNYAKKIKAVSGGFTGSILANCQPQLKADGVTILVTFKNETNEIEFNRMSLDLLDFLKAQLRNSNISFETQIIAPKEEKVIYTLQDRLNHIMEKYPQLEDWKDKFDLDIK